MTTSIYAATGYTGGADGAVDSIKYATLSDGDIVIVADNNEYSTMLRFKSSSSTAESTPWTTSKIIAPDDVSTNNGRWILCDWHIDLLSVYGDLDITGGIQITQAIGTDQTASGLKGVFTAGASLVAGDVCQLNSSSKMIKADATDDTLVPAMALCLETITPDSDGEFLLFGFYRDDDLYNFTPGDVLYLSTTAAALTTTQPSGNGEIVQQLGFATHADRIFFNAILTYIEVKV